jgi:hypothetical protein
MMTSISSEGGESRAINGSGDGEITALEFGKVGDQFGDDAVELAHG